MPQIVRSSPPLLIPNELFTEDKLLDYWTMCNQTIPIERLGIDELDSYRVLYTKPNNDFTVHILTKIYQAAKENNSICIDFERNVLNCVLFSNAKLEFAGQFAVDSETDLLYHVTRLLQYHHVNTKEVVIYYYKLPEHYLELLQEYYLLKLLTKND